MSAVLGRGVEIAEPGASEVAAFEREGYVVGPRIVDDADLDAMRAAMDRVYAGEFRKGREPVAGYWRPGGLPLRKTDNAWWADDTIAALATHPAIGRWAAALMAAPVIRLWQDQLLWKDGSGRGGESPQVGWHQDWNYWHDAASCPRLLTAWVAFDDVDDDNGAMQVIPGSHRWGLQDTNDFWSQDRAGQERALAQDHDVRPVTLRMGAGQVSFHHCMTLHGSGANRTPRPRRALAVHLMTGDVCIPNPLPPGYADWRVHYNVRLALEAGLHPGEAYRGGLWPELHRDAEECL